jgi:hypothetical protein
MKKITLPIIFLLFFSFVQAQNVTISGYVTDAETGEKLIGTNIIQLDTKLGVVSNNYGFYSFTTKGGLLKLTYSYIGYQPQTQSINLKNDTLIHILLVPGKELNEVVVSDNKLDAELRSTQMSRMELPMKELEQLPVLMGEIDVLRTIQLLPGVHTGGEGTAGLYVRGGGPEQNQILLDGIQIYNVYHLFGFFSVFNADAIKNITLYKGAFPANYGGRVSSVLDVRMKEGNTKELKGSISIGSIAANFVLEGPVVNENTSFIVSARRTYLDVLTRPFIKDFADGAVAGLYFYDLTGKVNHKFSDKSRLYLSTYMGKDAFYSDSEEDGNPLVSNKKITENSELSWANYTAALRWNYIFSNKLFSNTSVTYSNYSYLTGRKYAEDETTSDSSYHTSYSYLYNSGIQDVSSKIDFEYLPTPGYSAKFGADHIYHTFKPGISVEKNKSNKPESPITDTTFGNTNVYAHEFAGYFDNTFSIGQRFSANLGMRYSGFYVQNQFYQALEPRASINILLSSKLSVKASYSVMNQYLHLLTNTTSNMPTDLWLPATAKVKPQHSVQYALGSVYTLNKEINISVEGYYKTMDGLIEYAEGTSFYTGFTNWEDMVEEGKGWSYGLEVLVKKQFGKTTGWVGYTWSKTERQFENINFGNPFPYKYDRRHDLSIVATHKLKEHIDVSATWVYGTGNAFTMPHSQINSPDYKIQPMRFATPLFHFDERNSYRMPANHRLDVGIDFHKQKKRGERTWSFGVYNLYNRKNAYYLEYDSANQQMVAVSIFPILPYFRYSFEF